MRDILYHHGIKGMKWGVRRFQNNDGSLTPAGKSRYERDILENKSKKKDNRIDVSSPNPNRWVREDLERTKKIIDDTSRIVKDLEGIEKNSRSKASQVIIKKTDLSNMTDKELRDRINREILEQQYNKLFSQQQPETVSRGRERVQNVLEATGTVLALTSSAVGLALSIKSLKG